MRLIQLLVCFLSVFWASCSLTHAAPLVAPHPIHWQEWSRSIFERAHQEHKLILIYGRVSWCHWCQQMESSSFADPEVEQIVNTYFIPVRVDVEENQSVAYHYQVSSLPTVLVLDDQDHILRKWTGYYPSSHLARSLQGLVRE